MSDIVKRGKICIIAVVKDKSMFSFPYSLLLLLAYWAIKSYFKKDATAKDNLVQEKPKVKKLTFEKVVAEKENLLQYKLRVKQRTFEKEAVAKEILVEYKPSYYAHVIDIPEPFEEESQSHLVLLLNNKYPLQTTTNSPVYHNACNTAGNQFVKDRTEYMANLN